MDDMNSAYSLAMAGFVALAAVLALVLLVMQVRPRPFAALPLRLNAAASLAVFAAFYVFGGIEMNLLMAVLFALVGAALGFATGRTSKVSIGKKGTPVIKRAPWAPLVAAVSYVVAAAMIAWGTGGLFSVGLLVVLLGAMMQAGATFAELSLEAPGAPSEA